MQCKRFTVVIKINNDCVNETEGLSIAGISSNTYEDFAVTSEASLLGNAPVTEIIDVIKMETRETNPDNNKVLPEDTAENLSKKELKENQSNADKNLEAATPIAEREQENLAPNIKEELKRVCRKDKFTTKNNGKEA